MPDSVAPYPTMVTLRTSDKALAAHFIRSFKNKNKTIKWSGTRWIILSVSWCTVPTYPRRRNFLIEIVLPLEIAQPKRARS